MKVTIAQPLCITALLFFVIGPTLSSADAPVSPFVPHNPSFSAPEQNLDETVARIQRQTHGRILNAEEVANKAGGRTFRIKVLMPSGRVRVFQISARD